MNIGPTVAEIKAMLIDQLDALARELVPDGRPMAGRWTGGNPTRPGRARGSFSIHLHGPKAGGWVDFATGDKGDIIDLIAYLVFGAASTPPSREERGQAIRWAKGRLGLGSMSRDELEAARRATRQRQAEATRAAAAQEQRRRERAFLLWIEHKPIIGSLAERYLETRGILLKQIEHLEPLGFHPRKEHWREPHVGPVMMAPIMSGRGGVTAIHVTWLAQDGSGKADVTPAKMMLGTAQGGVIRISKGPSGLNPEEAAAAGVRGPLALTEGIETGLSVAMACPHLRVWAVGSIGNFAFLPKPGCADSIIVCAENGDSAQAEAALARGIEALESHRLPVAIARPHGAVSDMNDLLRRHR